MRTPLALALALALALTGCISNMGDLKDKMGASGSDEPVAPASTTETPTTPDANATAPKKAPVARISIFGPNGALVFKSSFQAEDPEELLYVQEGSNLSLIASDSETLEPGATIASFTWTMNAQPFDVARQAKLELADAGLYAVGLTVTDSNGKSDTQVVKLAVAPTPVEVVTELVTGPVAGANEAGQAGEATFELKLADAGVPNAVVQSVSFVAAPPQGCDAVFEVVGPDGASLGKKDSGSVGGDEVIEAGALPEGAYAMTVSAFACVAPEGVPITVTVTFLPVVEGLASGDGHGHAH